MGGAYGVCGAIAGPEGLGPRLLQSVFPFPQQFRYIEENLEKKKSEKETFEKDKSNK